LNTLQSRIESGREECPRLNRMLVWPDPLVSFFLDNSEKKSHFWLLQTNWPTQEDFLKVRP
jgi:hypothetical protein